MLLEDMEPRSHFTDQVQTAELPPEEQEGGNNRRVSRTGVFRPANVRWKIVVGEKHLWMEFLLNRLSCQE